MRKRKYPLPSFMPRFEDFKMRFRPTSAKTEESEWVCCTDTLGSQLDAQRFTDAEATIDSIFAIIE